MALVGTINSSNDFGLKNRIINGAMTIDQRNAGASYSAVDSTYGLDRWKLASYDSSAQTGKYTVIQSSTAPAGFPTSMLITSSAATTIGAGAIYWVGQMIEGFNTADLDFGKATAKTITVSFWVRSSLTGDFSGAIANSAHDRSYPFSYTINSANTFEYKTVTITGDTSGTWLTTNGIGIRIFFNLGSGTTYRGTAGAWSGSQLTSVTGTTSLLATSGATLYIAGVQLEKGSTATSFDYRDYGRELQLCQRYYYKVVTESAASKQLAPNGFVEGTTTAYCWTQFAVEMRISPIALEQTGTAANYQVRYMGGASAICSSVPAFNNGNTWGARSIFTTAAVLTAGQAVGLQTAATAGIYLAWSAEL